MSSTSLSYGLRTARLAESSDAPPDANSGIYASATVLLAVAQAVHHREISPYGTLTCWAGELGIDDAVALLDATLREEKRTNDDLTMFAVSVANIQAEAV